MGAATDVRVRCWRCHKVLANALGAGSDIDCRHCGAKTRT